MKILLFAIFLVMTFVFSPVYAEIYYPTNEYRVPQPPRYCIIEPTGYDDSFKTKITKILDNAVHEWNTAISEFITGFDTHPILWKLESTVMTEDKFSSSDCEIKISFKNESDDVSGTFHTLGYFQYRTDGINGDIVLFTKELSLDSLRIVGLHEIGHSLGLGHYVSDDNEQNERWVSKNRLTPSIMIPVLNIYNNSEIMDVDLRKLVSTYGAEGFYAFSSKQPPVIPTPTPSPPPKFTPPLTPKLIINPFESVQISEQEISVTRYDSKMITISGQVKESVMYKGHWVVLTIKYPDSKFVVHTVKPTDTGYFSLPMIIDTNNFPSGVYEVEPSYMENSDKNMNFHFGVNTKLPSSKLFNPKNDSAFKNELDDFNTVFQNIQDKVNANEESNPILIQYSSESQNNDAISQAQLHHNNLKEILKKIEVIQNLASYQIDTESESIQFTLDEFEILIEDAKKENELYEKFIVQSLNYETISIPLWIKNNAKWWSEGVITDDDFIQGIQYLIQKGIISVS